MNSQQLQLVTYEQAKRLKALGFDWEVNPFWLNDKQGSFCKEEIIISEQLGFEGEIYSAPTVALALKWFRDKKKIINNVSYLHAWYGSFLCGRDYFREWKETNVYGNYEAAESALLDELLTLLEKKK